MYGVTRHDNHVMMLYGRSGSWIDDNHLMICPTAVKTWRCSTAAQGLPLKQFFIQYITLLQEDNVKISLNLPI